MDERARRMIKCAILREALTGATRIELWAAARTGRVFASQEQVASVIDGLVRAGALKIDRNRWVTTEVGIGQLERLQALR